MMGDTYPRPISGTRYTGEARYQQGKPASDRAPLDCEASRSAGHKRLPSPVTAQTASEVICCCSRVLRE